MKAILSIDRRLQWLDVQAPVPGPNDVLLRVAAAGVNRADLLQARGLYPPPDGASEIIGLECSGWMEGHDLLPDCAYMALVSGGAYAEFVTVPASMLIPLPAGLTPEAAASLPEAIYTCSLNLMQKAKLSSGEWLWITAASSGIGTMAVQMAKCIGARVLVSTGSDEKLARLIELGADAGFNYRREKDPSSVIGKLTGGHGVDVLMDLLGGSTFNDRIRSLNRGGRVTIVGLMGGTDAQVDLEILLAMNITIFGTTLRDRSLEEKTALTTLIKGTVVPWIEAGRVKPVIDCVIDVKKAGEAHERMRRGEHFGKIVLRVG